MMTQQIPQSDVPASTTEAIGSTADESCSSATCNDDKRSERGFSPTNAKCWNTSWLEHEDSWKWWGSSLALGRSNNLLCTRLPILRLTIRFLSPTSTRCLTSRSSQGREKFLRWSTLTGSFYSWEKRAIMMHSESVCSPCLYLDRPLLSSPLC